MREILLVLVLFLLPQGKDQTAVEMVSFCDILRSPEKFDGKQISIVASYRFGFEWQELLCISCRGKNKVWLELGDDHPRSLERQLRQLPKNQGIVNGVFTGIFIGKPSAYGDGGYHYQLELLRLTNVTMVSRSSVVPESLNYTERERLIRCPSSN